MIIITLHPPPVEEVHAMGGCFNSMYLQIIAGNLQNLRI